MKRPWFSAACVALGLLLICFGVWCFVVWYGQGQAARLARLTTLLVLRQYVLIYAEETGRYPDSIIDALPAGLQSTFRDDEINNLVLVKSGQAFEPDEPALNELLFYEKEPTRYGFTKGWFEVYAGELPVFRTE